MALRGFRSAGPFFALVRSQASEKFGSKVWSGDLENNRSGECKMVRREMLVEVVVVAVSIAAITSLTLFSLGLSAYPLIALWTI
jgi:hypothetical protein